MIFLFLFLSKRADFSIDMLPRYFVHFHSQWVISFCLKMYKKKTTTTKYAMVIISICLSLFLRVFLTRNSFAIMFYSCNHLYHNDVSLSVFFFLLLLFSCSNRALLYIEREITSRKFTIRCITSEDYYKRYI